MNQDPTLAKLLEAWQDGGLPEAEQDVLLAQLDGDPELRRRFADQVAVLGAARAAAEPDPRWLVLFDVLEQGGNAEGAESFEAATMEWIAPKPRRTWYEFPALQAAAAAVVLLLAGSFYFKHDVNHNPENAASAPPSPAVSAVAVVVGASPDAGRAAGTYLKPGMITQTAGWITLQTLNGVSVTLDAPFRAELLSHDRILLNEGRARVQVPDGAQGFRLTSPAFDVVDLGTEFAAKVNSDGTGTCRVFEGKADISLLDSIGEVKRTKRLTASESVRVNPAGQDMQVIKEADADYPEIKHPPRPTLALPQFYAAKLMAMGPSAYWRFEEIRNGEVADEVTDGARLVAVGTTAVAQESGGNHSGELIRRSPVEYFQIPNKTGAMLKGDFSFSLFAQFEWLQNFVLLSAMRYDEKVQGQSFILQSYASFRRSGFNGTGLHAVLRDPPAWDGGVEVFGHLPLRPQHWYHIAVTRRGDQTTLYLDGIKVGSESAGSMPLDCHQIFVGRLNGSADQSRMEARELVGHIDELAVFPRALTDAEIRKLALTAK